MVSSDSKALIDEHLDECNHCRNELKKINSVITVKAKKDIDFIKKIKKKITRKNLISVSILLPCLLTLIILTSPLIKQLYYRYLYIGNRINVTLDLNIDDIEYDISDISIKCLHDDVEQQITLDDDSFSVKADDYGKYTFKIDSNDTTVYISFFQTNWWNIQSFTLSADIDTETQSLFYYITGTYLKENLSKGSYSDKSFISSQNNVYTIYAQIL